MRCQQAAGLSTSDSMRWSAPSSCATAGGLLLGRRGGSHRSSTTVTYDDGFSPAGAHVGPETQATGRVTASVLPEDSLGCSCQTPAQTLNQYIHATLLCITGHVQPRCRAGLRQPASNFPRLASCRPQALFKLAAALALSQQGMVRLAIRLAGAGTSTRFHGRT